MKPLLFEDREGMPSLDVGDRGRARHRSRASNDVLTGQAAHRRVHVTDRGADAEPCAETEDNQAGENKGTMSVDKRFDASGVRNTHWDYAMRATVVPSQ